jgi:phosphate acetyltransferase
MPNQSTRTLYVAPTGPGVGLTSVSLGLVRALDRVGLRVCFYKPIAQPMTAMEGPERSTYFIRQTTPLIPPTPLDIRHAQQLIGEGQQEQLMEEIIGHYQEAAVNADVVIVEGMVPTGSETYADQLNADIARTLDADVILVTSADGLTPQQIGDRLELAGRVFGGIHHPKVLGCIVNKVSVTKKTGILVTASVMPPSNGQGPSFAERRGEIWQSCPVFHTPSGFHMIGCVPWRQDLLSPRTGDIADYLDAKTIRHGELEQRRIDRIAICARTAANMSDALRPGVLIVTPGDRDDVIMATCMAVLNGVPIAGLLLTSGIEPDPRIMDLCERAFDTGLPVLLVEEDTYVTALHLQQFNPEVPLDDVERVERVMDFVARHLDTEWIQQHLRVSREPRMSPAAFRYRITQRAREVNKRIILPEGDEPRTVRAAAFCQERSIAQCILVGKPNEIERVAEAQGVTLPRSIEIIDPDPIRHYYVDAMVALRKHKGLTHPMAEQQLEDNVVLATMMLAQGEVDGLVSGAVHTTANTIRPALQLIRTSPGARLVSSVFFMLLPEQVLVYGDCAVNPNPNAEELADIAIQSADTALAFGISPRIAMISYSTGVSGEGSDVEKVREATEIASRLRPDLIIDGPLQYDAAAIQSVAQAKAPGSPVAGRATVFIFPDLNTGNTTYKAVQRSAGVVSIGPVLQGLKKPVNDLSRGALVDDIIYTIAVTAIQAEQAAQRLQAAEAVPA